MIDIIIVTYNAIDKLKTCLKSIERHTKGIEYLLTIVNNNGSDGTDSFLRRYQQKNKNVNVIDTDKNLGFSAGANLALKKTANKFIALLDDDVEVGEGWLESLYGQIKNKSKVGIVGPKILSPDKRIWSAGYRVSPFSLIGHAEIDRGQRDYIKECDALIGPCWLMKRELIEKVGPFDERFFPSQHEDIDYCLRARLAGYKIIYNGEAKIIHRHLFRDGGQYKNNQIRFLKKWFGQAPIGSGTKLSKQLRYRKTFINYYLKIKVDTNSKRICRLIENFSDFPKSHRRINPNINITYYLDEVNFKNLNNGRKYFYQDIIYKNRESRLYLSNKTVEVEANLESGAVKAKIFDYQESFKEGILELIFCRPLYSILACRGLFFLHASAVYKSKDGILITGACDSGKSTLALTLALAGFNILTDDKCFIKLEKNRPLLFPFPTKMGLTDRIIKRYPQLNNYVLKDYKFGEKLRIPCNFLSDNNNSNGLRCKMLISPRYKTGRDICLQKISKQEAFNRLFKEYPLAYSSKKDLENSFVTLCGLVNETDSFELVYNDSVLDKIPAVINKIFK